MREIKFRAWDGNSMRFGGFSIHATGKLEPFKGLSTLKVDSEVMQFIGLTTLDGVEVYQGDIVDVKIDGERCIFEITFTVDRDFNGWEVTPQHIEDGLKVIGNIHQHPELLENK